VGNDAVGETARGFSTSIVGPIYTCSPPASRPGHSRIIASGMNVSHNFRSSVVATGFMNWARELQYISDRMLLIWSIHL
jgi:hypothetical protein